MQVRGDILKEDRSHIQSRVKVETKEFRGETDHPRKRAGQETPKSQNKKMRCGHEVVMGKDAEKGRGWGRGVWQWRRGKRFQ